MPRQVVGIVLCVSAFAIAGCRTAGSASSRPGKASAIAAKPERVADRRAEAHAHYAQGVLHEVNRNPAEALDEFHRAAELDPGNEELIVDVARRWLVQKKPERALELLKLGAAQTGASGLMDALLGTAYAQAGKTNLAFEANQRAIKKAPRLLAGYHNLHLNYLHAGRTNEAMKVLDQAGRQRDADAEFLVGLAELYVNFSAAVPAVKSNAFPKASAILNRAELGSITNIQTRIRLADGFNVLGDADKAAKLYQALLQDYPQAPMLQENLRAKLTDIYLRGKDRKRAIEQLELITKSDPMNVQAHYYLATLAAETGDAVRAEEHYRQIIVLNPKFEQAYYDLATTQLSNSKTNEVFATLKEAQKRFGENFVSEFLLGVAYARVAKYEDAVKRYTAAEVIARATDAKRLTPLFYFQMGSALERKGDYSEAVKYFEKALQMKPDFAEAANYLGYMWAERGENLERAKGLIEIAVKAEPKNNAYLDSMGWVLFKLGKAREALPFLLQAVEIADAAKEPDATLYDHLGDVHMALGEKEKARAAWRNALSLGPSEEIRKKLDAVEH